MQINAYDLPKHMRKAGERGLDTRLHSKPYPKLAGLAVFISLVIVSLIAMLTNTINFEKISTEMFLGLVAGALLIVILGFLDDLFELSAALQFLFQFLAAFCVVLGGLSLTSINFIDININLNFFEIPVEVFNINFLLIFPGSILTIIWIVGLINVVNWVGGIDALNATVSGVAFGALVILTLSAGEVALAVLISIYLGSMLGVLPFNYNPGKIMYGSIGDYLNGYLLAAFTLISSARWSITFIILAIPLIDGLYVFYKRLKDNPKLRRNPLKVLSLSGKDHLHHRLLAAGFTPKNIVLFEGGLMIAITSIVILFTDIRLEYVGFLISCAVFLIALSSIAYFKRRNDYKKALKLIKGTGLVKYDEKNEAVVKMYFKKSGEENDKGEKFIY